MQLESLKTPSLVLDALKMRRNAERMTAPLFLVHAERDIRVPIEESYQLRAALSKLGREPSFLVFDDDGHHFDRVENRVQFATQGVAFLIGAVDSIKRG